MAEVNGAADNTAATTNNTDTAQPDPGQVTMDKAIKQTENAMGQAVATNAAITALTIRFQVAMQGINATREAATEAYKKAGEANNSMHQ